MTESDEVQAAAPDTARLLAATLDRRRLRVLFQPLVDLVDGAVVGHEALVRGPAGTVLEPPGALFAAARAAGRAAELDWAARVTAFRSALAAERRPDLRLFVNAEPETLDAACPHDLVPDWVRAHRRLRVVVEITERSLLGRPAELLRTVRTLRELGWEVALDDVGANPDGVALLPVVDPDVVKLDATLLAPRLDAGQRRALHAVEAWASRSGALVVAEGIESERQHERAVDLGATWGQGFRFGRPGALPEDVSPASAGPHTGPRASPEEEAGTTPYRLVPGTAVQVDAAQVADALLGVLDRAERAPDAALLLLTVAPGVALPAQARARLAALSERCALVVVLSAEELEGTPGAHGLRTSLLDPRDPLAPEAAAVLLGPGCCALVAARERRDGRADLVRSQDPAVVTRAARVLLGRTAPLPVLRLP